jgi:hypothetical protein
MLQRTIKRDEACHKFLKMWISKLFDSLHLFQVEYILRQKKDLSRYLRPCKTLHLGPDFFIPNDADDDTTHSTLVDVDEPMGSSDSENLSAPCKNFVRKKQSEPYICARSANGVSDDDMPTNMSRRKGVPQRSPLC